MKDLLKDWKLLVQNSQSNGISSSVIPSTTGSTLPPSTQAAVINRPRSATPPTQPHPPHDSGNIATKTAALTHRKAVLNRLMAVKTTPATPPTTASTRAESTPATILRPEKNLTTPTPVNFISNGSVKSLTVRLPLSQLPSSSGVAQLPRQPLLGQPEETNSLIVSIPLTLVDFTQCTRSKAQKTIIKSKSNSIEAKRPTTLTDISSSPTSLADTPDSIGPLIISIPRTLDTYHHHHHKHETTTIATSMPPSDSSQLLLPQNGKIKPAHCIEGVDGCYGNDNGWYSWTEVIPNPEPMVTVLPYVYIDGLEVTMET